GTSNHEILPADQPARQATEILQTRFEGFYKTSDLLVVAEARNSAAVNEKEWSDFRTSLTRKAGVLGTELQETSGVRLLRVGTDFKYGSKEASDLIDEIRAADPDSFRLLVGGENARLKDFVKALYSHFPAALAMVLFLSYIVLLVMFRSIILPAKAILLTGLSLTASYGALVWLFQDGHLSGLLGFSRQGYLEAVLPILIFSILFGLSMDYEVFLLSRIRELYEGSGDNEQSVIEGLGHTSGIITSAALILILVSLGFAMADIVPVKAIGIGMALAVAVDATLVRAILLPAAMKLLGKWNWWWPFQKKETQ
ncbi:MAG: MMPL family transporter, partial [Spirochaetia bacterium]|nr:MMPL family transporter [Spirochaetia bacterium]